MSYVVSSYLDCFGKKAIPLACQGGIPCVRLRTTDIKARNVTILLTPQNKERICAHNDCRDTAATMVRDRRRFGAMERDSCILVLRISLLQWWVVQWRWSCLDTARWTKVVHDAKHRQMVENWYNPLLRSSKWLTKRSRPTLAGWNKTVKRIGGESK